MLMIRSYIGFIALTIAGSTHAGPAAGMFLAGTLTFAGIWWLLAILGIRLLPTIIKIIWPSRVDGEIEIKEVVRKQPLSEQDLDYWVSHFIVGVSDQEAELITHADLPYIAKKVLISFDAIATKHNFSVKYFAEYHGVCRYYYLFFTNNSLSLIDDKLSADTAAFNSYLTHVNKEHGIASIRGYYSEYLGKQSTGGGETDDLWLRITGLRDVAS